VDASETSRPAIVTFSSFTPSPRASLSCRCRANSAASITLFRALNSTPYEPPSSKKKSVPTIATSATVVSPSRRERSDILSTSDSSNRRRTSWSSPRSATRFCRSLRHLPSVSWNHKKLEKLPNRT
jgi:hypothetical protein